MISAARSTPSACASSSCASRSGVSEPAAAIAIRAESSASRTGVARRPASCCGGCVMSVWADPGGASRRGLRLQAPALLVGLEPGGELVQLALQHLVEVVRSQLDAVVGDAP